MTADELDGVATFYNLIFRRPVGRHVILVCDSVTCWIMGVRGAARARQGAARRSASARPPPTAVHAAADRLPGRLRPRAGADDRRRPPRRSRPRTLDACSSSGIRERWSGRSQRTSAPVASRSISTRLRARRRLRGGCAKPCGELTPTGGDARGQGVEPARPRRRRLPDRHEVELRADGADARRSEVPRLSTPTRWSRAPSRTAC